MSDKKRRMYFIGGISCGLLLAFALLFVIWLGSSTNTQGEQELPLGGNLSPSMEAQAYSATMRQPCFTTIELEKDIQIEIELQCAMYVENYPALEPWLDARLVYAVIEKESRGNPDKVNGSCVGLMQLDSTYADDYISGARVEEISGPQNNVKAGIWKLAMLLLKYQDLEHALTAYNSGETGAEEYADTNYSSEYSRAVIQIYENGVPLG